MFNPLLPPPDNETSEWLDHPKGTDNLMEKIKRVKAYFHILSPPPDRRG